MKILLLTLGSRGDVEPFAVLGQELLRQGHEVLLSAPKNFAELAESYQLPFAPVSVDFQALVNSEEGKKLIGMNPFTIRKSLNKWVYPLITESLELYYQLAQQHDAVVYHSKTLAFAFADQLPQRFFKAVLVPAEQPTAAFANPLFPKLPLPKLLWKKSYFLSNLGMKMMAKPIQKFRKAHRLPLKYAQPKHTLLYAISELLLPRPNDYPDNAHFTGFWFSNKTESLPADVDTFLSAGAPPVVVTFGSMPNKARFSLVSAVQQLLAETDLRIVLVKGWGIDQTDQLEANPRVKLVASVPFAALLPKVRAVVHHGGVGTTAACLRAGVPSFICPVLHPFGDQYFWGQRVAAIGAGLAPIPLASLTQQTFVAKVKELTGRKDLQKEAKHIAGQMKKEYGVGEAVRVVVGK